MAPAAFNTKLQLRLALDYAASAEALFGTSDLSPLTTPECTPPPSPTLMLVFETEVKDFDASTTKLRVEPAHTESSTVVGENSLALSSITRPSTPKDRRKAKKKLQGHANRSKRRQEARNASYANLRPRAQRALGILGANEPLRTEIDSSQSSHVSTGFTGLDNGGRQKKLYSLEELVGEGSKFRFKLQAWDGK